MTREQYKKLNDYLNDCFLKLEENDPIFIENLYIISAFSDNIIKSFHEKIENYMTQNKLTFEEVFYLSREIIESINKKYLNEFDNLIQSGILDFGYNNEYNNSSYIYNNSTKQKVININRYFSYDDVGTLIHEFMHYTNIQDKHTYNARFLTEFISIYFQEYAKRYLIEKKEINTEEINTNSRIINFLLTNQKFNTYCLVLLAYNMLGDITPNTPVEMKNILGITDKTFEKECLVVLEELEKDKATSLSNENAIEKMVNRFNTDYLYIVGTSLAFYALEHCKMEDIVRLNEKINSEEYAYMSIKEVLNTIGIKINIKTLNEAIECVKNNIQNSKVIK